MTKVVIHITAGRVDEVLTDSESGVEVLIVEREPADGAGMPNVVGGKPARVMDLTADRSDRVQDFYREVRVPLVDAAELRNRAGLWVAGKDISIPDDALISLGDDPGCYVRGVLMSSGVQLHESLQCEFDEDGEHVWIWVAFKEGEMLSPDLLEAA